MIVTCERCATQFQLDDARIPESGVRVRCSRCKHAFEVLKSGPKPSGTPPPGGPGDDEESDWQFNEDPPRGPGSTQAPSRGGPDAAAAGPAGDEEESLFADPSPSGLDLADDSRDAREPQEEAPARAPDPPPRAGPHREANPDFSAAPGESGLDLADDAPRRPKRLTVAPDPEPEPAAEPAAHPEARPAPKPAPEPAKVAVAPPLEPAEDLLGDSAEDARPDELSRADWDVLSGGGDGLGTRPRTLQVDPDELVDERPRWHGAVSGAGQAVGWVAVVLLFVFGLRGALLSQAEVVSPLVSEAGSVELHDVATRFVDHADAGWVYVVSGRVENRGNRPVPAGSLAVEVRDAEGGRLAPPVPAAAPLSSDAIRVGRIEGPWRKSPELRPGESRSFEAVIGALPPEAEQLRLITIASAVAESPATPGSGSHAAKPPAASGEPAEGAAPAASGELAEGAAPAASGELAEGAAPAAEPAGSEVATEDPGATAPAAAAR